MNSKKLFFLLLICFTFTSWQWAYAYSEVSLEKGGDEEALLPEKSAEELEKEARLREIAEQFKSLSSNLGGVPQPPNMDKQIQVPVEINLGKSHKKSD